MNTDLKTPSLLLILLLSGSTIWSSPTFRSSPSLVPNSNPAAPQAGVLTFKASGPVTTKIIGSTDGHRFVLKYGPDRDPTKGLAVVGMRPDRTYTVTVHISDASGQETFNGPLTISTPTLPNRPELMPRIEVEIYAPEAMAEGFTLFNPRRVIPILVEDKKSAESEFNSSFGMLAVVDAEGEVIWYYQTDSRITDYRPIANGHIVFITSDNRLIEIDYLGNTVASWCASQRPGNQPCPEGSIPVDTPTFHHSFQEYPNGDFLILSTEMRTLPDYYTSETDKNAPRKTQKVMGDVVLRMTRKGEILWKWKAFDHLDPYKIGYMTFEGYWIRRGFADTIDWSHANAVRIVDDGKSFLVNFRLMSGIAKVEVNSQEIQWLAMSEPEELGEELKEKAFKLTKGDWFWMPHAPWITDKGTLLIFNNDNFGSRPFGEHLQPRAIRSRAEEYAFDEEKKEMHKIWQSRFPDEEPLHSWAMGSVQPLKNDNVLVGYGFLFVNEGIEKLEWKDRLKHPGWTQIREYAKTDPASLVWSLTLLPLTEDTKIGWSIYGGLRVPSWPTTGYKQ
ncbi:MAG: aryl-sulfate sulfotransferase [Verrucomicrobia bacterium]|nr:aryl-sulfate sulfotransferase [Verrucomicrobiota bacterium]